MLCGAVEFIDARLFVGSTESHRTRLAFEL